jgi:hypothetical protein
MTTSIGTRFVTKAINPNGLVVYLTEEYRNRVSIGFRVVTQFEGRTNYCSHLMQSQTSAEMKFYQLVKTGAEIAEFTKF